jgi:hairless
MVLFFYRPERIHLTSDCKKFAQSKRRRPLDKRGNVKFIKTESIKKEESDAESSDDAKSKCEEEKLNGNSEDKHDVKQEPSSSSQSQSPRSDKSDKCGKGKLDKILKKLADRMTTSLAINGNGNGNGNSNGHHAPSQAANPYSLANHIASSINTQPHQHVSPRKRILRELEKVSLEDTKRSRPKTQSGSMNGIAIPASSISPQMSNGSLKNHIEKASVAPPVSRPISSYSITSLLAHNNNSTPASSTSGCNSINDHSSDSSSTSHYHHRDGGQQQRLSLSQNSSPPKSPSMQQKRKSPNTTPPGNINNNSYHSPNQSPSPEHHAFHKYRPTTTPTAAQSSSPYSGSYHSPNYMRGSPSPHGDGYNNNRLRTTGSYQHSPSHYVSSPSQSYTTPRDSSLSPNVERSTTSSSRSTPTSSGIRTVPKKTAALRQQFSSPTMESKKSAGIKNDKPMDVDSLLRPSALVAPPAPHPAQMYPYMYTGLGYLPAAVPPAFYHHQAFYNPAMMAAASYRIPGFHPGAIPGYPGASLSPVSAAQMAAAAAAAAAASLPPATIYDKNSNGQRNHMIPASPATHPSLSPYVPTSPWNPIPLTNHSINDGNLIAKAKDELSSGEITENIQSGT